MENRSPLQPMEILDGVHAEPSTRKAIVLCQLKEIRRSRPVPAWAQTIPKCAYGHVASVERQYTGQAGQPTFRCAGLQNYGYRARTTKRTNTTDLGQ